MSFRESGSVPLPSTKAKYYSTICRFCNVACGYDVYVWPAGESGKPEPGGHGIVYKLIDEVYNRRLEQSPDFTKPAPPLSAEHGRPWISEGMVVKTIRRDWRNGRGTGEWEEVYVALVPSPECPINWGNHSIRGGTQGADRVWSPWTTTGARRLKYPLVRFGGRLERVSWDYAIDLVARVIKGVIDKWGIDRGFGKEGHDIFAHRADHGGGGGGGMIYNTTHNLFFFVGVRTAFARIHNRPFFGPENPAIGDAGPGAMNNSLHDLRLADVMVFWGANSFSTATVMFIKHAIDNLRGATTGEKEKWFDPGEPFDRGYIIVVDPRMSETAKAALAAGGDRALILRPRPGTDIVLANAIARVVYEKYRSVVEEHVNAYRAAKSRWGFDWDEEAYNLYLEEALQVGRKSLDEVLSEAENITGVPRSDIEKAADWLAQPKAGGFPKRVWLMYEKGIIWNQNYRSIYALVDLCALTGALRGRPGNGCQRQGGHQEGYAGPAPPPPPWTNERTHISPWWFKEKFNIRDYKELFKRWMDHVYGTYNRERWVVADSLMPTTDFRLEAGQGRVLWVSDQDNYRLGPNSQRLKAAVSDRAWRVTRYVFAEEFAKTGGARITERYDTSKLTVPVTTPVSSEEYAARVLKALEETGGLFVVVQDIYPTFIVDDAHVVLPAAENNGETPDVRMSVHERRYRIADAWVDPPGEAKPDWWILASIAKRIVELYEAEGRGDDMVAVRFREAFKPIWDAMNKPGVEVENEIFKTYIANADEFYSKLSNALGYEVGWEVQFWTPAFKKLDLDKLRKFRTIGVVLPLTEFNEYPDGTLEARGVVNVMEPAVNEMYREEVIRVEPDGTITRRMEIVSSEKARGIVPGKLWLWPAVWSDYSPYVKDTFKYKYWVINGRYNEIWQTGYHDPGSEPIIRRHPYNLIQVSPEDARAEGLDNGDIVLVYNDNGSIPAVVWVTDTVSRGTVFLIMAHPYMVAANAVTTPSVEPVAQNPDYKLTKANLKKIGRLTKEEFESITFREIKFTAK
ncbi:MAG: arsenate reductase (azurin) large subunit [Desulfurococcales archaeon]|nr:arsenate reductase (azurin) large subunit [Desulfurococcales archaeon]